MSGITTHILDTSRGCPAQGVPISLELKRDGQFAPLAEGVTNTDGRVIDFVDPEMVVEGTYRIRFDCDAYFQQHGIESFYPYVEVVFRINNPSQHFHVPLLLNPFGYSTYRGS